MKRLSSNRLSIETLESREMMAADAVLAGGVLNITGTEQADRIVVSQVTTPIGLMTVKVTIHDIATGNQLINKSFINSSVSSIKVECGGGDDVAENNTNKPSTMYGDNGADRLVGGAAVDTLFSGRVYDQVENTGSTLIGNGGNDYLYGCAANDVLEGGDGNDQMLGGRGNDTLRGGADHDKLFGGLGRDWLYGDDGSDTLYGKDSLCGQDDSNYLNGGRGNDVIFGAMGMDQLWGDEGNDTLHGGQGKDDLYGSDGDDTLYGGDGNDQLYGGDGNDELHGNNGDDLCRGDRGDDWIAGGDGFDELIGDMTSGGAIVGFDTMIFDLWDLWVDGLSGATRWWACPKATTGPYAGHARFDN
jgi:Ca2+-binding RTX toxin-like protein